MATKLLDRVREEIRARHYRRRTEEAYAHWIRRYIAFHGMRHPRELGASEIAAFFSWLAVKKNVAPSTQNQAFSAVLFLYRDVLHQDVGSIEQVPRAKAALRMPVVLGVDEVRQVLKQLSGVPWIIVSLL